MREDIFNAAYIRSLAIMGGTFDPIHYGHLMAAEVVRQEYNVDRVVFIPSGIPPHKANVSINDTEHRYLMTLIATLSNPYFEVSRMEIDREGFSYTVDTIAQIRKICGDNLPIYFITGVDAVMEILTWKNPEKLLPMCNFVAVTRPGYNHDEIQANVERLKKKHKAKITILETPDYAISSSEIRARIKNGLSIKYWVPEDVEKYIEKYNLYESVSYVTNLDYNLLKEYLKVNLSPRRVEHTIGVADAAVKLAHLYSADVDKAYASGLLHDIAKEIPTDQKIILCSEYGIELDETMLSQPELIHGFLGAELAKTIFGVTDEDVLNAIRYHTTGRARMTLLEKIIFLSDLIEVNRSDDEEITKLHKYSEKNINKAVIYALKIKMESVHKKKLTVHPLSISALEYMENIR